MEVSIDLLSPTETGTPNAAHSSMTLDSKLASCALCRQRKVKCDKTLPCSNCVRAKVECVSVAVKRLPRGRQGGRKSKSEGALLDRIAKLESLVKDIETQQDGTSNDCSVRWTSKVDNAYSAGHDPMPEQPASEPLNRYVGTSFWVSLSEEISGMKDVLGDSSSEGDMEDDELQLVQPQRSHSDFIFSPRPATNGLENPTSHQIYVLCEVYLANVDPVFKVLHAQSLRNYMQDGKDELCCSPGRRGLVPLKFAIYFAATLSLSDGECQQRLGADRTSLLSTYRAATENALSEADFLNTLEMSTLQALAIYLVAVRSHDSSRLMWTLVSLAIRIAQCMGLNLEQNNAGYSLFHREMRRRLWWQICILDMHAADDRALNPIISPDSFNTSLPLGVNDDELHLGSSELVNEQERFTDMTFCLMCHEIFDATRQLNYVPARQPRLALASYQNSWKERNDTVIALQCRMEEKYTRHLNLTVPFHWATKLVGDLILANMWLWLYRPLQRHPESTARSNHSDPGILRLAVEVLEKAQQLHIDPAASSIRWVSQSYVQWHALAVVAAELCVKKEGPFVERGWAVIEPAFCQIVQNIADSSRGMLWRPIKKLVKRAQRVRDAYLGSQSIASERKLPVVEPKSVIGSENFRHVSKGGNQSSSFTSVFQTDDSQTPLGHPLGYPQTESFDWNQWCSAATAVQNQYPSEMDQMAWVTWEDFVGDIQCQDGFTELSPNTLL